MESDVLRMKAWGAELVVIRYLQSWRTEAGGLAEARGTHICKECTANVSINLNGKRPLPYKADDGVRVHTDPGHMFAWY